MAKRKMVAETRTKYASLMAKLEGGKSQMNIGDAREFLKKQLMLEVALILRGGYKSQLIAMRKEALQLAKDIKSGKRKISSWQVL